MKAMSFYSCIKKELKVQPIVDYLVIETSSFLNFPHSMWGVVESYSNLTPRGLEVPISSSESLTNLNKEVLESFLLPKRQPKKEESKYEYMIFVWNGKAANALLKVYSYK
jgi:hypothetical protein